MKEMLLQKAQRLKQESEEIEQRLKFVDTQIADLQQFLDILRDLQTTKEKEVLTNLGCGVYAKASLFPDEKLFVEVGAGILIRKTPSEAQRIVENQLSKFKEAKFQFSAELESYASEFHEMLKQVKALKEKG